MQPGTARWLATLILLAGAGASAEGDIVYGARYYKPGWTPSHSQIWRINPNGSGRRAVTTDGGDDHPVWMPDGKTIRFHRLTDSRLFVCEVSETGGPVRVVAELPEMHPCRVPSPDGRATAILNRRNEASLFVADSDTRLIRDIGPGREAEWSPDGHLLLIVSHEGGWRVRIWDRTLRSSIALGTNFSAACWLGDGRVAAAGGYESERVVIYRTDGTAERDYPVPNSWTNDDAATANFADCLVRIPGDTRAILYGRHNGGSSQGSAQLFYRMDLQSGTYTEVVNGREVAWAPDGLTFVTGAGQDFQRFLDQHTVAVSSLQVAHADGRPARKIVTGLVLVGGFDWRRPQDTAAPPRSPRDWGVPR